MSDPNSMSRSSTNTSIYSEQRIQRGKSILDRNLNKTRGAEVKIKQYKHKN